jgi:hypothetical protein
MSGLFLWVLLIINVKATGNWTYKKMDYQSKVVLKKFCIL